MRVAILAGGFGSRLAEHTDTVPKPMVPIGDRPILWHIMKIYSTYGHDDFVIALGYMSDIIKEYFVNYRYHDRDISIDTGTGDVKIDLDAGEKWRIRLIETGLRTQTKSRVAQIARQMANETFMLTYGDGVSDINIAALLAFHRAHGKIATMSVVRPTSRYGTVDIEGDRVTRFKEKPQLSQGWVNGGFFILEPSIKDYVAGSDAMWEHDPLENLTSDGQLMAYRHEGFWQSMDSLRDVRYLESLWQTEKPPWKVWDS